MDEARIAELLAPFLARAPGVDGGSLSLNQVEHISMYIDILLRWNARINLTSVREPEAIVTRHFGESIFAAWHLFPGSRKGNVDSNPHVIDVGSGAGFPGLPIKLWAPQIRLTLIESNQKKATFLREVIRRLGLDDVDVFAGRANTFTEVGDFVTIRAVERFEAILPVAAGVVGPDGSLAMLAGKTQVKRLEEIVPEIKWSERIDLPQSVSRVLIIGRKNQTSP
jgi:16S rRNA (guanine527-N7)-methyltransferase